MEKVLKPYLHKLIRYLPRKPRFQQLVDPGMGKNKNGVFVPPKGKPSGNGRENRGLAEAGNDIQKDNRIADEYTDNGNEELSGNVPVRHPNRHLHKGEDTPEYQGPPGNH